jgi:branched-chain amino acid transport system substrate-binding protein
MSFLSSRSMRSACVVLLGSLALAACGGGDSGGGSAGSSSSKLTGDPILLGSILTITNPAWDNSGVQKVNDAWSSHINDDLGGIDGRPVKVETCDDRGDPAGTSQCLRNLIDKGVVGFVNNSSLAFGANALPAMEQAGLVNLGGWPITPAEFSSTSNFPTTPGASGSYPSLVVYARLGGADKLAVVCTNTPSGQGVCDSMKKLWQTIGGGDYFSTLFDPTAPDFTPVMSQVAGEKPDAVVLAVGEGAAPRMFQAAKVAGIKAQLLATSTAATKNVFDAAGDAVNGTYFSFASVPADTASEDAATYRKVMKKYAPDQGLTNQTAVAASSMQYAYDLLSSIKGDITPATVKQAVDRFKKWDGFLTHPMNPSSASQAMPAISNPFNLVAQYKNGKFTPAKVSDPGKLGPYIDKQGDLVWIAGSPVGSS